LDDALAQRGHTRADIPDLVKNSPDGVWRHNWTSGKHKYHVRIHAGNQQYTNSSYVFRVAKQTYGQGWQYLGLNRTWYHTSVLTETFRGGLANPNFNYFAAVMTHLPI